MYEPKRLAGGFDLDIRGLRHFVRTWGREGDPAFLLLHGGQDASATFQFMVDCFQHDWRVLAPDWRGHGKTAHAPQGYWFQDYVADLDALMEKLFPNAPAAVVGHSLGGNAACVYAGLRPERVSCLVSLDGFGLPDRPAEDAPAQMRRWLASWREAPRPHKEYSSLDDMAARLRQANGRLSVDRSLFLARELSTQQADGTRVWAFDPRHRGPFGALNRKAEWTAYLSEIKAPALFIGSDQPFPPAVAKEPGGIAARVALIQGASHERIEGAGHNLHHDEPAQAAALVERFLMEKGNLL